MRNPRGQLRWAVVVVAAIGLAGCSGAIERYSDEPGLYRVQLYPPYRVGAQVAIRQAALFCGEALPRTSQEAAVMAERLQMRENEGYLTRTILEFRCP